MKTSYLKLIQDRWKDCLACFQGNYGWLCKSAAMEQDCYSTHPSSLITLMRLRLFLNEYYWEPKKSGALFLTVQLLPSPPVSSEDTISLTVQESLFVLKERLLYPLTGWLHG
jgi:hypothetical protein